MRWGPGGGREGCCGAGGWGWGWGWLGMVGWGEVRGMVVEGGRAEIRRMGKRTLGSSAMVWWEFVILSAW